MTGPLALGAALLALNGTGHCASMCGGFVAASFTPGAPRSAAGRATWLSAAAMHAGRIASYCAAGAIAGGLGSTPVLLLGSARLHAVLFTAAALMLIVTGLRVAGLDAIAPRTPRLASRLFQWVSTTVMRTMPADSPGKRLMMGALWGWAPCALVYSALPIALVSGSSAQGAIVMLAFGVGTMPALLGAGWLVGRWHVLFPGPLPQRIAGAALILLALAGIGQALGVADTALGAYCVGALP